MRTGHLPGTGHTVMQRCFQIEHRSLCWGVGCQAKGLILSRGERRLECPQLHPRVTEPWLVRLC